MRDVDESRSSDSISSDTPPRGSGDLTERQKKVLGYIDSHIKQHGFPPTIREIGLHLGIKSTNGVNDHLNALQKKGFLTREEGKSRTLQLVHSPNFMGPVSDDEGTVDVANDDGDDRMPGLRDDGDDDFVVVPMLGRVAAGLPILAEQTSTDTVKVSSFFLGGAAKQKVFALTVVGDSMIEDGIFNGDYLFVKKQSVARNGEIVVAMIDGEATVKRYFPEGDRIRFQPANSRMEPIFVEKKSFRQTDILGVVVGVYRKV
ncbi:MAG: transcriptional repressor LexA [Deltaproteobacteria bacterium]|nr:transcriptional repressor LexA [Deltaproteobacteria bacterium]